MRNHTWLWGTFASAALAYLLFLGPTEVLLPYVVKEELGGSGTELGLVFGAGGIGSIGCALAMGQRGIPRRDITFMYRHGRPPRSLWPATGGDARSGS